MAKNIYEIHVSFRSSDNEINQRKIDETIFKYPFSWASYVIDFLIFS